MSKIYEEYAHIDAQIAALSAQKEQLRPQIIEMMMEQGVKKVETAVGKFSLSPKKSWTYPDHVTALEVATKEEVATLNERVKEARAKAESTLEATFEESESLRFTSAKL